MKSNRIHEMLGLASAAAGFCDRTIQTVSALRDRLGRATLKRDSQLVETLKKLDADLSAAAVVN